jgi:hypothetical protein
MSIAQLLVAGEGKTHPADFEALRAFRSDSVNLPWIIFRAAFRANHIEGLPQRARALFAALARTVDAARPFADIFARRELLTGRAMVSMRTLYRSLEDLETAGLVERRPQARYVEAGLFGRAYLRLTPHAAALLGFVEPAAATQPAAGKDAHAAGLRRDTERATQSEIAQPPSPSFSGRSANLADGAIYKDLSPGAFQKRQSGQVPADLQRLLSLGFSDFLIFKLMRQAREAGKRLSDVVEATWANLKKAHRPICYLGTLLRSPVDFSNQLRQRNEARAENDARKQRAVEAMAIAKQNAGKVFEHVNGKSRHTIDSTGQHLSVYSHEEGVERQIPNWMEGFAAALAAGRLREVTGVPNAAHKPVSFVRIEPRTPVTPAVREHVAGLRLVLEAVKAGLSSQKNKERNAELESSQLRSETARVIASPV